LAVQRGLTDVQRQEMHALVHKLETCDEFIQRYIQKRQQRDAITASALEKQRPTAAQLFLDEIKEIERIAYAQFQMHKRNRESAFRNKLRQKTPSLSADSRETVIEWTQSILEDVRHFCGTKYLTLFISPQRYISYESNPSLLPPFAFAGVEDEVRSGILHLNWRKAGLMSGVQVAPEQEGEAESYHSNAVPSFRIWTQHGRVQQALKSGLKGAMDSFFGDASVLCQMYLSDVYRAVLLWGPFPHLSLADLEQESHFLEEVSELVMMHVLSLVELSDSEHRTTAWGDVAGLLAHYSRRAMTPVSTGVRIISDYLQSGGTYSREDAQGACDSLEAASRLISQAVRAPLFSFAAMAEEVYEFAPASLEDIVRDCVALYRPMALDKKVTIKVDQSVAELPEAELDAVKIRDAIGYVVDNAIKYSHRDKEIRIYGESSGRHIRLTVEDFGQGIREEERQLIFGRGYQGERSRKAIYEEGEGMGLFHARLIVEAHKGEIWCGCRSGPRSEGSARLEGYLVWFTFELPIRQSDR
jgi:signal transduction histidine kinase